LAQPLRGFLKLATLALGRVVDEIFSDSGSVALLGKLYCTPEWQDGTATLSWLATLRDYFRDLSAWLDVPFFKRAAQVREGREGRFGKTHMSPRSYRLAPLDLASSSTLRLGQNRNNHDQEKA